MCKYSYVYKVYKLYDALFTSSEMRNGGMQTEFSGILLFIQVFWRLVCSMTTADYILRTKYN